MVHTREMERVARDLVRKKTEPAYIRHYLMDAFQVDSKTIDVIFRKLRISEFDQGPPPKK